MPEFLSRSDSDGGSWIVGEGTPTRGDAWTNLTDRHMRVPFGDSDTARAIRAHEMAHAKASPLRIDNALRACAGIPQDIVIACEEIRVNEIAKLAGFDTDLLMDGSEKKTGEMLAKMGRPGWNGIVQMIAATANTKACNSLIAGIRSVDKDMANAAAVVRKTIRAHIATSKRANRRYGAWIADTTDCSSWGGEEWTGVPTGFYNFTIPLAQAVNRFLINDDKHGESYEDGEPVETLEDITEHAAHGQRGRFAKLILDSVPLTRHVDGKIGRKRIASQTGRNPRRMQRLLTDPEMRVFDRRSRGKGGVILIDQSGSMHLTEEDVSRMIEEAPGCVIIGYSHSTGDTETPNAWILANRGKVAEKIRGGNGGNGVDGPVLRFALTHRRTGEPFVWICDGVVTDGVEDRAYANLEDECAALVAKHGIHMAEDVSEGIDALQRASRGERLPMRVVGPLTEALSRVRR